MFNFKHVIQMAGLCLLIMVHQPLAKQYDKAPPDLFNPTDFAVNKGSLPPQIAQYEPARVNISLLTSLNIGSRITLNLRSDASYVGIVKRIQYHSENSFTVSGFLESDPQANFAIVVVAGVAAATVRTITPAKVFQLRYVGDGVHLICEIDADYYPPDADGRVAETSDSIEPPAELFEKDVTLLACVQPSVFDVMIVYTAAARSDAGGENAILALSLLAIEETNQTYENSQITSKVRLVYCDEVGYTEAGNTYNDHLDFVSTNTAISSTRTLYGADFVSLWVADDAYCGMGWCYTGSAAKGFSIVHWDCATGNLSYAHEMGHNQGCAHDRENATACDLYSYSFGWRFMGDVGYEWRTNMAYEPGIRIQYFSNPNVVFDGQPTGVALGDPDEAHNALTINNTSSTVRAFRPSVFDLWVDFDNGTSPWSGTFNDPYLTIQQAFAAITYGVNASELPTLWIKAGSSNETPTFSDPLIVRSCGGPAIVGE